MCLYFFINQIMRLAILVAGVVYPCQNPWKQLSCLVTRTNGTLFTSLEMNYMSKKYNTYMSPARKILLNMSELHAGIRKHIPWIHERKNNMVFLKDELGYHTPYIIYRRFILATALSDFSHVLVLRPDSLINCEAMAEMLMRYIQGIHYWEAFSDEHNGHLCPQSINDQQFYGDATSVKNLLSAFPKLKYWHKEWESEPGFDKWWKVNNIVRPAHFFLNAEGIYGKILQKLNLTCVKNTLPIKLEKKCTIT